MTHVSPLKTAVTDFEQSLKVLVNIAKSKKLRHYVQKVCIITARVTEGHQPNCCEHSRWKPTVREHEAFLFYKKDQELLQKGADKDLLIEAFSNLPRLQILCLRDHPNTLLASVKLHGLTKFLRTTGIKPAYGPVDQKQSSADDYYQWLTHIWRTMMLAVADSGITSITHLLAQPSADSLNALSPITDVHFRNSTMKKLSKAFKDLIYIDICFRSHVLRAGKRDKIEYLERANGNLKKFCAAFGGVKNLIFSMDGGEWTGHIGKSLMNSKYKGKKPSCFMVETFTDFLAST